MNGSDRRAGRHKRLRLLNTGSSTGQMNMAVDSAILTGVREGTSPATIRFFRWASPTLSIGYAQEPEKDFRLDLLEKNGIDLVRRPTGGGAILHERDLCYSVAASLSDPRFPSTLRGSYGMIGEAVILFLNTLGIDAQWGGGKVRGWRPSGAACFDSASPFEILTKGRKIVGSAQRRTSGAFLQQGSIMLDGEPETIRAFVRSGPSEISRENRQRRFPKRSTATLPVDLLKECFEKTFGVECVPGSLTPREKALLEEIVKENRKSNEWDDSGISMEGGRMRRGGTKIPSVDGRPVKAYSFSS